MMRANQLRSTTGGLTRGTKAVRWRCAAWPCTWLLAWLALGACDAAPRPADVIVMASGSDLESANPVVTVHPMSRQMQRHMLFVPLVHLDSALQPVPALARRWQWSDDRRTLTFTLRDDVRWHDGQPTTAHDVRFTFNAVRDPAVGSPRLGDLRNVQSIDAPDDSTVIVRFAVAPPRLPTVFAELPPVPAHRLRDVTPSGWRSHEFATNPVGNGPFMFGSRTPGTRWRFIRNTQYPAALGGPPWAREIVIVVVDEPSTKLAGLVSGDLDVAGVSPSMAGLVSRDPLLSLETPPVLFTSVLAFNTTRAPFDDARVRRAISLAIDRGRVVQAAVAGYGIATRAVVPPGIFALESAATIDAPSDSATAARLLDEAGWRTGPDGRRTRDGKPLALTLLTAGSGELAAEQLLQADLQRIGIALSIRTAELASFLTTLRASEKTFDLAYTGIPGDIALGHLRALLHGDQRGGALDYTGFTSALLDRALDAALGAPDIARQRAAWAQVDSLVADLAPIAVIYHARGVQGRAASLRGIVMDLRGELATVARWQRAEQP